MNIMTSEEEYHQEIIKINVKGWQNKIKDCNDLIESTQKSCTHPRTFEGLYSWRVGAVDNALICSDCGKFIKYLKNNPQPNTHSK